MPPASMPDAAPTEARIPVGTILTIGVVTASLSPILIRYATVQNGGNAEPLAISFWRCFAGALLLAPFALGRLRSAPRSGVNASAVAGLFLAVHFATWITSLELTTVAASVLLVSTTPIFVALTARFVFRESLGRAVWAGVLLSFAGAAVVSGGDLGGSSVAGNGLALAGGAGAAGYVLAGQAARRTLGILEYAVLAYGISAVILFVVCVIADVPLAGYTNQTWLALAAVVVGPQLLGHTLINFALKDIDATIVAVSVMVEPIIATALAFVLFDETPSLLIYPGGAAILIGIFLATVTRRQPVPTST